MQVSAYNVVKEFGIEALAKFYSVDNAEEIMRVREEYYALTKTNYTISSFNDGDSIFEVMFDVKTFECWRNDHEGTALDMLDYVEAKVKALTEADRIESLFGLPGDNLMRFLKAAYK